MRSKVRVHCFQQVPEEGLACILDRLVFHQVQLSYTRFYMQDPLPQVDDFDFLIVMGGPMSVYEEDKYPWLKDQKILIKQAVEEGKAVLGICLGSQFIASALGAKVYSGKQKEIGWFPLNITEMGQELLSIPEGHSVFHWHGDTFDLPEGAQLLASSASTPHQGFAVGDKVVALQFHLEVNEEAIEAMTTSFAEELQQSAYVQDAETIKAGLSYISENQKVMFALVDRLLDQL